MVTLQRNFEVNILSLRLNLVMSLHFTTWHFKLRVQRILVIKQNTLLKSTSRHLEDTKETFDSVHSDYVRDHVVI